MNKFIYVVIAYLVFTLLFSSIPYIFPTLPTANLLPYQLWIYAVLLFIAILPSSVGSYVYSGNN